MSGLSGYAQGINEGLRSLATIQGIRTSVAQNERGERADARQEILQGREDTAYKKATEKAPFKTGMSGGADVQNYVVGYAMNLGLVDADGNIENQNRPTLQKTLNADTIAQHQILQIQRRVLMREIGELQKSLGANPSDDESGQTEKTMMAIREKTAQKINLDNTDKAFLAEQAQKNKEKEFGMKERETKTAEAKEKREADKPAADKIEEIIVMRDRYSKGSKEWKQWETSRKTLQEHLTGIAEIKKRTDKEGTAFQSDLGFLVEKYGMTPDQALSYKKQLAGKDKKSFVLGIYDKAIGSGDNEQEAQAKMTKAAEIYDQLSGTAPAPATGAKTIRPAPGAGGKAAAKRMTFNPKTGLIE